MRQVERIVAEVDGYEVQVIDFTLRSEPIEVTSNLPEPDPDWRYVDAQGHEHTYSDGYPTLVEVEDWPAGVDVDGFDYPAGTRLECRLCGEEVRPGLRGPTGFREYIAGPVTGELVVPWPHAVPSAPVPVRIAERELNGTLTSLAMTMGDAPMATFSLS